MVVVMVVVMEVAAVGSFLHTQAGKVKVRAKSGFSCLVANWVLHKLHSDCLNFGCTFFNRLRVLICVLRCRGMAIDIDKDDYLMGWSSRESLA